MLVLSSRAGHLSQRIGPRIPMSVGPVVAGLGLALLTRVGPTRAYVADVLPGVLVFALGMSIHGRSAQRDRAGAAGRRAPASPRPSTTPWPAWRGCSRWP